MRNLNISRGKPEVFLRILLMSFPMKMSFLLRDIEVELSIVKYKGLAILDGFVRCFLCILFQAKKFCLGNVLSRCRVMNFFCYNLSSC